MSVTPAELCALADTLALATDESSLRASVSRTYYGAYHACIAWHGDLSLPGSLGTKGGMHEQFLHQLANPDPTCSGDEKLRSKVLSYSLRALKGHRTQADYQLGGSITPVFAAEACASGNLILEKAALT